MNSSKYIAFAIIFSASMSTHAASDAQVERDLKTIERMTSKNLTSGSPASMVIGVHAGPGRQFTWSSVQSVPASQWTNEMKSHSKRIAINDYCTNPDFEYFRVNNVTAIWTFKDTEGRHITTNSVNKSMCR